MSKPAKTKTSIDPLIAKRWSPRAFDETRDLTTTQVTSLLEATQWAPSCYGDQPWYYVVCHKSANPKAWEAAFSCLVPFNQDWVKHVPLLLLSTCKNHFHHNGEANHWAQHDTGAASENLCLQAASMGLAAHQMAGFDSDKAKACFQIPEGYTCLAMIAVGYQTTPEHLPSALQEAEAKERARNPLAQHFFNGTWGEGR
ncbi:MAG: nitroreductase family protein [Gammaproteobacteria bacterium]|nr:nitroreductase family protein [Gammaproteobacteria bacterium]